jgi:hypothetical protein
LAAVEYTYCIVPTTFDLGNGVLGIDEQPIRLVHAGQVAAVVSTLDSTLYNPVNVEQCVADLEWLKPRAIAHDHVVTWSSDRGPTLPMPMWSLFSNESTLVATLMERQEALRARLEKVTDAREYTVRLFVHSNMLQSALSQLSSHFAELEQSVTTASPGQAYLLQRKIEHERKVELRNTVRQIARETYETLAQYADEAVHDPVAQSDREGQAVLNASFLISNSQYEQFRRSITDLINRYQPSGFQFEFTGPWPPYHFVHGN